MSKAGILRVLKQNADELGMKHWLVRILIVTASLTTASASFAQNDETVATPPNAPVEKIKPIVEIKEPPARDLTKWGLVAAVQWNPEKGTPVGRKVTKESAEAYKKANREALAKYIRTAAAHGAKLVVTPEFGVVSYPDNKVGEFVNRKEIEPYVEQIPGTTTNYFSALAKELGIYIQVGFAEVDKATDLYYNAAVVLDPDGKIVVQYRKVNLFTGEDKFLKSGGYAMIYDNKFFGRVAVEICADIYFIPLQKYFRGKVDAVTMSASWARMNHGMYAFKSGAKAMDAYLVASNNSYFPDAGIVNPDGTHQSWIRQSNGLVYGYLPLKPPTQP